MTGLARLETRDWRVTFDLMRRFLPFARPYHRSITFAGVLIVITILADVVQPWPLKVVIDNVLRDRPISIPHLPGLSAWLRRLGRGDLLLLCAVFMIARTVVDGIFTYFSSVRMTAISQQVIFDIRRALFNHIQKLSLSFFDRHRTGDLVTRFTGDSANIEDMLVLVISVMLTNGLTIAVTIFVMLRLDVQLTLVAFTVLPFLFVLNRYFTRRIRAAARERRRKEGEIASLVQEDLTLIRTVQSFTRESHEAARFDIHASAARAAGLKSSLLQSRFGPLSTLVTGAGTTLVVYLGARSVLNGRLTLGTLIVMMTYLRSLFSPVRNISRLVNVVTRATVSAERVSEILDTEPEVFDAPDSVDAPPLLGHVRFENVDFAYRIRDTQSLGPCVLKDISLDVPAGTTVALVGHTGAGKTSLASLLLRLYDPVSGCIRFDGNDLRSFRCQSLRRQISVVPQEAVLFRATVWENIAYGSDRFPPGFGTGAPLGSGRVEPAGELMREIQSAAIAANAHEFIGALPDGYFTVIGERGNTLSGGQRQRIAVARAMIRGGPILILDEPTTGLDSESENLVLEAIDRLKVGRTTFIIAHRLTTIRSAGLVVVLEGGRIVQKGTHAELYKDAGRYRDFYDRQFEFDLAAT